MREVDIFQMALGLTPPWEVSSCAFSAEKKRLDIRLAFPRGSVFACPECGRTGLKAHDTTEKRKKKKKEKLLHDVWASLPPPKPLSSLPSLPCRAVRWTTPSI